MPDIMLFLSQEGDYLDGGMAHPKSLLDSIAVNEYVWLPTSTNVILCVPGPCIYSSAALRVEHPRPCYREGQNWCWGPADVRGLSLARHTTLVYKWEWRAQ